LFLQSFKTVVIFRSLLFLATLFTLFHHLWTNFFDVLLNLRSRKLGTLSSIIKALERAVVLLKFAISQMLLSFSIFQSFHPTPINLISAVESKIIEYLFNNMVDLAKLVI